MHNDPDLQQKTDSTTKSSNHVDLELAVAQQELMAGREENADLRAKVYLLEREKAGRELALADRANLEKMLRAHVQHLQEELGQLERSAGSSRHLMSNGGSREALLRQRVENLLETLDKITRNNSERQKQSEELIGDLKRANSTLTEALDRSKKKYQAKLRKMEQQLAGTDSVPKPSMIPVPRLIQQGKSK